MPVTTRFWTVSGAGRRRVRLERSSARAVLCAGAAALTLLVGCFATGGRDERWTAAEVATANGDWPKAADLWNECIYSEGTRSKRPFLETGRALAELGLGEDAVAILGQGLLYHPDDPDLLEARARLLHAQGFNRAAEHDLQRASEAAPERGHVWLLLGRVRLGLDQPCAAIDPLRRAATRGCDEAPTWLLLARANRACDDPKAARACYQRAVALGGLGSNAELVEMASLFTEPALWDGRAESLTDAWCLLDLAVQRDPQDADAWFVRGVLHEQCADSESAVRAYRRAIEVDNFHLQALTNLALLHASVGDAKNTREIVDRALELETDPKRRTALASLLERPELTERSADTRQPD